MKHLIIEPTEKTPKVVLDPNKDIYVIQGRSIPEDSAGFYKRVYAWVENEAPQMDKTLKLEMRLEYFNTSSSKCILDLFRRLEKLHADKNNVQVLWHYEQDDDDMQEAGEDYSRLIKVPFEIIEEA